MDCYLMSFDVKAARKDGKKMTAVDLLIERFSRLIHAEFRFSYRHNGISFSSTMAGDDNGTRFKQIEYSHPNRWVPLILPMTNKTEDRAWDKANEIVGKPYDFVGVSARATGLGLIKPAGGAYWCNKTCAELIKAAYGYGDDFVPDSGLPDDLFFDMLRRLHGDD